MIQKNVFTSIHRNPSQTQCSPKLNNCTKIDLGVEILNHVIHTKKVLILINKITRTCSH